MKAPQSQEQPVVFVVDDDDALREALKRLFGMVGLRAETFAAAAGFLKLKLPDVPTCLVVDIRLPGALKLVLEAAPRKWGKSIFP